MSDVKLLTVREIQKARTVLRNEWVGEKADEKSFALRTFATIQALAERLAEISCPKCQGLGYLGSVRTPECTCPDCNGTGKPWKDWKEALTGLGKKR